MVLNTKTAAVAGGVETGTEEIPPEILAAIAAAVTAFLGANHRIGSIQLRQSPHEAASRWSKQGRAIVLASHNLRKKR